MSHHHHIAAVTNISEVMHHVDCQQKLLRTRGICSIAYLLNSAVLNTDLYLRVLNELANVFDAQLG